VVCSAALVVWDLVWQPDRRYENFAQTAFAITWLVSLLSFRGLDSVVGQRDSLIKLFAVQHGFADDWSAR